MKNIDENQILLTFNKAAISDMRHHFSQLASDYIIGIESIITIEDYLFKLYQHSTRVELWEADQIGRAHV